MTVHSLPTVNDYPLLMFVYNDRRTLLKNSLSNFKKIKTMKERKPTWQYIVEDLRYRENRRLVNDLIPGV